MPFRAVESYPPDSHSQPDHQSSFHHGGIEQKLSGGAEDEKAFDQLPEIFPGTAHGHIVLEPNFGQVVSYSEWPRGKIGEHTVRSLHKGHRLDTGGDDKAVGEQAVGEFSVLAAGQFKIEESHLLQAISFDQHGCSVETDISLNGF